MDYKSTISDIFSPRKNLFAVPNYQRAYSWDREQWKALLDDLKEQTQGGNDYFFGNI